MEKRKLSSLGLAGATWKVMALVLPWLLILAVVLAACGGKAETSQVPNQPSGLIKARTIEPSVDGDILSAPLQAVKDSWNTRFGWQSENGPTSFMAYVVDGDVQVRADVCPPCQSTYFSLEGNVLKCDRCGTTFDAKSGSGINGACVNYPKAAVPYTVRDGNMVLGTADLLAAYQNTLKPGWP